MDKGEINGFIRSVLAFEPEIRVQTDVRADDFLTQAVNQDSRFVFYISAVSGSRLGMTLIFRIQYRNRDIPLHRVYRVRDGRTLQNVMRRETGAWAMAFGVVAHEALDMSREVRLFLRQNTIPQMQKLSWSHGSNRWGWCMCRFDPVYRGSRERLMEMNRRAEAEAVKLSRAIFLPGMPPEAKCLAAHQYLASTVRYQLPGDDPIEEYRRGSAYGPLVDRVAVCQGYAEAFQLLMKLAGIDCLVVSGGTKRGGDESHAWNLVRLPGEQFLHVDVTWDSREEADLHYYLRSDAFMADRTWDRENIPPSGTGSPSLNRAVRWLTQHADTLVSRGFPRRALPKVT